MSRFLSALLILFTLLSVGCDSTKSMFGCSENKDRKIDLQLGEPGKTDVENNLPKNDNTHTLKNDESIKFTSDDGEAIITHSVDREINEGDIIIGNSDEQYLVTVKKVFKREDGSTQVLLRQARIGDIVGDQSGSLKFTSTPVYEIGDIDKLNRIAKRNANDGSTIYETDERGRIIIRNLELFNIDINNDGKISKGVNKIMGIPVKDPYEKLSITTAAGGKYKAVVNEAIIEVIPTIRSNAEWSWGKISEMKTRLDTRVRYRVDISYEAAGHIQMEALLDQFMPKKVIPIRVPGTPPVYLDIELGIPAGVSVKASHEGKTRIVYESEYEFYSVMKYDRDNGVQVEKDQKVVVKDKMIETKSGVTKVEAELFLKPQITARLYRVVGPYAYLKPYVRGEIDWPSVKKKDDLYIGVTGGVGIELSEPIFLTQVTGFDSGKLFDFYKSFDLDGAGAADLDQLKLDPNLKPNVTVNKIGPEGFVVFNLKEHRKDEFLRYELLDSTKNGLMVPSETFYMDGILYYYPLSNASVDSFKVRITGDGGKEEEAIINVATTPEVLEEVSKDRFGTTTNSYKVSTGTIGDFRNNVPEHKLGGSSVGVHIGPEGEGIPCMELQYQGNGPIGSFNESLGLSCEQTLSLSFEHRKFLEEAHLLDKKDMERYKGLHPQDIQQIILSSKLTKIENVKATESSIEFDYFNLANFYDYVLYKKKASLGCYPKIKLEALNEKHEVGFKVMIQECEGLSSFYNLDVKNIGLLLGRPSKLNWKIGKASHNDFGKTIELKVDKKELFNEVGEGRIVKTFSFNFPLSEKMKTISLTEKRRGYGPLGDESLEIPQGGYMNLPMNSSMALVFQVELRLHDGEGKYPVRAIFSVNEEKDIFDFFKLHSEPDKT